MVWIRFQLTRSISIEGDDLDKEAVLTEFLSQLQELDVRLDKWFDEVPDAWWPTPIPIATSHSDVWDGVINAFTDKVLADMFVVAYMERILIHEKILQVVSYLGHSPPSSTTYAIQAATDAFCACIPWIFGCEALGGDNPATSHTLIDPQAWLRAGVTMCMKWIPVPANLKSVIPLEQRQWLRARLEHAAAEVNFAYATILVEQIHL